MSNVIPFDTQKRAHLQSTHLAWQHRVADSLRSLPAFLLKKVICSIISLLCSFVSFTASVLTLIMTLISCVMGGLLLLGLIAFIVVGGVAWLGHAKVELSHWAGYWWTAGILYIGWFLSCMPGRFLILLQRRFVNWLREKQNALIVAIC